MPLVCALHSLDHDETLCPSKPEQSQDDGKSVPVALPAKTLSALRAALRHSSHDMLLLALLRAGDAEKQATQ